VSKLGIALEEADESVGWLETTIRAELTNDRTPSTLIGEARQILAILAASRRTAQERGRRGTRDTRDPRS
jgi:four helix bundle protein